MAKKHHLKARSRRRLNVLLRYMAKRRSPAHFNMSDWFNHYGDHALAKPGTVLTPEHLSDCGTTACAMGHAATIGSFQRAGLKLVMLRGNDTKFTLKGRTCDPMQAAERFFGIDNMLAYQLFIRTWEQTPAAWAREARRTIDDFDRRGYF